MQTTYARLTIPRFLFKLMQRLPVPQLRMVFWQQADTIGTWLHHSFPNRVDYVLLHRARRLHPT